MQKEVEIYEAEEAKIIKNAYRALLRSIKVPVTDQEKKQIREGYELAVEAHKTQRRKTGEPYILHPIAVARICAEEMGLGAPAIVAALLHDVVEDTSYTLKDVEERFGSKIAMIVDGLTKFDKAIGTSEDDDVIESPQAENFKKVLLTLAKDVRVVLIKMADRLHNMRTIDSMPKPKQRKIASETTFVYAPLAHRLGLYSIKTEFEDLCLKVNDSEAYDYVVAKLEETEKDRNTYIQKFIKPIKDECADKLPDLSMKVFGRVKSIYSISKKVKLKQIPFEDIYDIFAVRVVVDVPREKEKSACWQIYSVITDLYVPVPERLKDWIAIPKANGYESLHITVMGPQGRFVEIQIRSSRMDEISERGVAAHWKYKGVGEDNLFEQWLSRAREVLENPNQDAIDFLNDFKANLFNEEIYVFTPKGEMKYFPKGATALDFAFEIHTEVGARCQSVRVNHRIMPISYKLQNGDQLEVVTKSTQKPTEDWLNMVMTSRAKSKIRQALNTEKRKVADDGKEILSRKLQNMKLDLEANVELLVKYFNFASRIDLYYALAMERISFNEIKSLKIEEGKFVISKAVEGGDKKRSDQEGDVQPFAQNRNFRGVAKLMVDNQEVKDMQWELATCCNPVQGDSIFAYISSKGGYKIHRTNCSNAEHLHATYGYRIKSARWVDSLDASFIADIKLVGIDDFGVVQQLTDIISRQLKINMRSINLSGKEGYFEGAISVIVNNRDQLVMLIRALKGIEGVSSVERVD